MLRGWTGDIGRLKIKNKPSVAIVGVGSLASFLAPALWNAGYRVVAIVGRSNPTSMNRARRLAKKVGARAISIGTAVDADLLWFCVPDREIAHAVAAFGTRGAGVVRFAFHSSGALGSRELAPLKKAGIAIASVHPLMTFVPRSAPSLEGVPFAIEGDAAAVRLARQTASKLGAWSFRLPARRKPAYHAWATMTSPLLLAYLVTLEEAAHAAGISRAIARKMSLPIIRQTLANYGSLGPAHSFSGPFIRGDAGTVAKHAALFKRNPETSRVYVALARAALDRLPVRNRRDILRALTKM